MNIHKILEIIPDSNKNKKIARIEMLVQHLIERTVLEINVLHVDSLLLSYPPRADDSEINSENEPDRNSE
ncbi:hypothetical protein F8M41_018256 [Gigaspora margarita]|uniref:Uncharacterized protein n=1 Tax=Gigaspora margarita TaxID=4874 RepID=A0A8H4ALT8_GIGMA|nr:hypothetical protein F8M41_018256 [Gigaspora margarita]